MKAIGNITNLVSHLEYADPRHQADIPLQPLTWPRNIGFFFKKSSFGILKIHPFRIFKADSLRNKFLRRG